MAVDWYEDPEAFSAQDWTPLVLADREGTVFHTPAFLKLYWEEFGSDGLRIAVVRRDAEPVAAAAFELRQGVLTWLGGFDVTDYMGPVGDPEQRDWAAGELMSSVAGRDDWTKGDLAGLPLHGKWLAALAGAAERAGLPLRVEPVDVAPFIQLPDSFDLYLSRLDAKLRHEIRRKDRRLRAAHPDVRLVDSTPETIAEDLDRFMEMHRSSRGEKGRFMVPGMELFFRRLGFAFVPDGTLRLAFLETAGVKIAAAAGFRWQDRFLLYNSAYDHVYAHDAPGMVLIADLIRSTIEEGYRGFDMLKGDLPYKYRFGARARGLARLRLRPRGRP
ncbi:MAG: GNAT family N-acetyltransferase [Actinobacteria bacterium]|nr:GNAT family N-acetyltransferase [Actinomycetota bacterium]